MISQNCGKNRLCKTKKQFIAICEKILKKKRKLLQKFRLKNLNDDLNEVYRENTDEKKNSTTRSMSCDGMAIAKVVKTIGNCFHKAFLSD